MFSHITLHDADEIKAEIFKIYGYVKGAFSRAINDIVSEWMKLSDEDKQKLKEDYDNLYRGKQKVVRKEQEK